MSSSRCACPESTLLLIYNTGLKPLTARELRKCIQKYFVSFSGPSFLRSARPTPALNRSRLSYFVTFPCPQQSDGNPHAVPCMNLVFGFWRLQRIATSASAPLQFRLHVAPLCDQSRGALVIVFTDASLVAGVC